MYHLLVDRPGIPLAVCLSAPNTHDSLLLEAVVDAVPAVKGPRGRPGRPRERPAKLHLDKGLRLPTLPTGAAPTRHHPAHRPPRCRATRQARPPPVGRGAVTGVAAGLPAPADPLRAARRHPAWVCAAGVRADLPQAAEQAEAMKQTPSFSLPLTRIDDMPTSMRGHPGRVDAPPLARCQGPRPNWGSLDRGCRLR